VNPEPLSYSAHSPSTWNTRT